MIRPLVLAGALALGGPGEAQELRLPGNAVPTRESRAPLDRVVVPTGVARDGTVPSTEVVGETVRRAWRIEASSLTVEQIVAPLRAQLVEQGWTIGLDCDAPVCGGYDFRYALDVIDPPDMHVDLGNYVFLAAQRPTGTGRPEVLWLLASRALSDAFVQITRVTPPGPERLPSAQAPERPVREAAGLEAELEAQGHAPLDDLSFGSGSASLGAGPFESLEALVALLEREAGLDIVLVGHTDATGDLSGNIALSRRRAEAVRRRLVEMGAPPGRVTAEGVGFLAPRATNATEEGRLSNRRVEAVAAR